MKIINHIKILQQEIDSLKAKNKTIGFVPTMGALHQGHVSLVNEAKLQCDIVVCSVFVNPTQFNDKKDLERYPRTLDADAEILTTANCDILFVPSVEEMYPEEDTRKFTFGRLDELLEGPKRPGHFNGVALIVSKLFYAVQPHKAYFGLKDYQQVMVVKNMTKQLNLNIEIIPCAIKREEDGLAMSSRNTLLSLEERKKATLVPQWMQKAKKIFAEQTPEEVESIIRTEINQNQDFKLDYFEICEAETLEHLSDKNKKAIALIAVFLGKVRLIDNIELN